MQRFINVLQDWVNLWRITIASLKYSFTIYHGKLRSSRTNLCRWHYMENRSRSTTIANILESFLTDNSTSRTILTSLARKARNSWIFSNAFHLKIVPQLSVRNSPSTNLSSGHVCNTLHPSHWSPPPT